MSDTLTLEQAVTDLVEVPDVAPNNPVEVYDPGTLESPSSPPAIRGDDLSIEQAADLIGEDDEDFAVPARHQPEQDFADETTARKILHENYGRVAEAAEDIAHGATVLADYLGNFLTPLPQTSLAVTNPAAYVQQEAQHNAEVETLTRVLQHAALARQQANAVNTDRHREILAEQNVHLVRHFPECADPSGRTRFFEGIRDVAYECDFSEDELRRVVDHRLFRLAHLAAVGLKHQEREAVRPRPKVRPRTQSTAIDRLTKSGLFADAMEVEFD